MQVYNKTDQQLHQLCQVIAKANRTFVDKKEDDSHTNLSYDAIGGRIMGRWIDMPNGKIVVSLDLQKLDYIILNSNQRIISSIESIGKTRVEIENKLTQELIKLGLDITNFSNPLHFEIPDYDFAEEPVKAISKQQLAEWKAYRNLANEILYKTIAYLQVEREIRIWPHHFDTGTYIELNKDRGIGAGLAMEDTMVGSPYLYLSGYAPNGSLNYENLPSLDLGRWEITESWKGAVLPLTDLQNLSKEKQDKVTSNFMKKGIDWYLKS